LTGFLFRWFCLHIANEYIWRQRRKWTQHVFIFTWACPEMYSLPFQAFQRGSPIIFGHFPKGLQVFKISEVLLEWLLITCRYSSIIVFNILYLAICAQFPWSSWQ
jgi:hypothetical protein